MTPTSRVRAYVAGLLDGTEERPALLSPDTLSSTNCHAKLQRHFRNANGKGKLQDLSQVIKKDDSVECSQNAKSSILAACSP